ncbi:hypothetical protein P7C70_g9170, partial [Phenoliferia sp. Uapishka_3]
MPSPPLPPSYQPSDLSLASTDPITSTLVSLHTPSPSTSSASSSSDSDSDADSDDDSDQDTTDSETNERLKDLFLKAKASAREKANQAESAVSERKERKGDTLAGQEEVVRFDDDDDEDEDDDTSTPLPSSSRSRPALPQSLIRPVHLKPTKSTDVATYNGSANDSLKGKAKETLGQDLGAENVRGEKWGTAPRARLSKKEMKERNPRTAGKNWFNMPATELTPEVKREIQAMRLRNALDPKRFYKGGAKDDKKLPEFFSLGHILPSTASASTAPIAAARKRTFVEELVEDDQARAYTKRKTSEVMTKGMSGKARGKKGGKGKDGKVRR